MPEQLSCTDGGVPNSGDGARRFDPKLLPHLSSLVAGRVREFVEGRSLTTYAIGGPLRAVVTVESSSEAAAVITALVAAEQPYRVLGYGSNVLIADSGVEEWILRLGAGFKEVRSEGVNRFTIGGAASLMAIARRFSNDGRSGLEFAAGIPASIGGAAYMNAGAHGAEISDRIRVLRGVRSDGIPFEVMKEELPWSYRHSGLPEGWIVTEIEVELMEGDRDQIAEMCAHNLRERRVRQPLSLPSAGSVFKNPGPDLAAGSVLEQAGMKGVYQGGAQVSPLHANWIVNPNRNATAVDVISLMELCKEKARQTAGVELQAEVKIWAASLERSTRLM